MKYQPGDFHGLSDAEVAKMKLLALSREGFDRHQKMMCYGHCCQAVHHLTLALEWLDIHSPRTGARVAALCRALALAFTRQARKAKTADPSLRG